jgi:hypothetical protein
MPLRQLHGRRLRQGILAARVAAFFIAARRVSEWCSGLHERRGVSPPVLCGTGGLTPRHSLHQAAGFAGAETVARDKLSFNVWAYVIMPEHAHLLVWPTQAVYNISAVLSSIKQSVVKRALIHVRRIAPAFLARMEDRQPNGKVHYRIWQRGGGYDRNVEMTSSDSQGDRAKRFFC